MSKLIIRQYRPSDKDDVFDLHVRALKNDGVYIYTGIWEKDFDNIEGIFYRKKIQ